MALSIRREYTSPSGTQDWIQLNRHAPGVYSVTLELTGTGTMTLQGTLAKINRETVSSGDVFNISGASGITTSFQLTISDTPLEALRLNVTSGTPTSVIMRVMQNSI